MASSSKSALEKLRQVIAARAKVMSEVRGVNHTKFKTTVTQLIRANLYGGPGECMVYEIAKATATQFGLSEDEVKRVPMHNGWVSAEFTHHVETPMPPPQRKGVAQQPPVVTETIYKVVKASGRIKIIREHLPTIEKEDNLGGEVVLGELQRPSPPRNN